ncbi:hypothetical protein FA15DRAFT_671358 [Coprinopsis marcescibilis]|uniref:SH3 domain-containing protein n=1 Tax=Coprinopsis marcescibilis TaxID=230819 RepID=A0A5C3KQY7_COPMA|nr:hypothetical protein FA15DRAFT_671358 [Coprinopsis marcescibilis]
MTATSARRQPSTTSLSKYARSASPLPEDRANNFCNAFWGFGDAGVDVLFARMRGATRTIEELRNFWKERAVIEEDYAKRLAKLSKTVLGRDEIGALRAALDIVKSETETQASSHAKLAQDIRTDLEASTAAFHARQLSFKRQQQTSIEKEFKTKQAQEVHVNKAREKYENDALRINSFTAQRTLVQGKELDKIHTKLERAKQTVQSNERDFANFVKILGETTQKWELSWKAFCDNCQDLEEDRIDFMKDNVWTYANSVSAVCVSDDESCERVRVALEHTNAEDETKNFVASYGTGSDVPDPPAFVNYTLPDATPSASAIPTARPANFTRVSTKETYVPSYEEPVPMNEELGVNAAGIGAGGARRSEVPPDGANRRNSVAPSSISSQPQLNGAPPAHSPNPSPIPSTSPLAAQRRPISAQPAPLVPQDPHAETIDPTAETYIKVGSHAYKVDLSRDPQLQSGLSAKPAYSPATQTGFTDDPLEKQLQQLQSVVSTTGSTRRNTLHKPPPSSHIAPNNEKPRPQSTAVLSAAISPSALSRPLSLGAPKALSPPGTQHAQINRSPSPARDYRDSADAIVGAHPASSRPPSPNPPTAAFMMPKSAAPPGTEVIHDVLADYQQSLPGERKSISRNNSRNGRPVQGHASTPSQASITVPNQNSNLALGQTLQRPSSVGHAGIGAHGAGSRSNSPQPPSSRGPSPAPHQVNQHHPQQRRQSFIAPPAQSIARAPSPNSIGIALDPNGRVLHDEMAQGYQQHQQSLRQPQHQQQQQHRPQSQQPMYNAPPPQQQQQRRASYIPAPSPTIAPPVVAPVHAVTPPPPANVYQQPPQGAPPGYGGPPPAATHPSYASPSQMLYQQQQPPPPAQQPVHHYQQQVQQPPPQSVQQQVPGTAYGMAINSSQRNPSVSSYFPPQQQPQQQQYTAPPPPVQQAPPQNYQQQWVAPPAPAPVRRSPSPQPPGAQPVALTEDGQPIQFYVKALYDYVATIDEEFDFQAGDIIAVTSTPEDGWWTGELLDEARRQRGRNVFPSNFVCLF